MEYDFLKDFNDVVDILNDIYVNSTYVAYITVNGMRHELTGINTPRFHEWNSKYTLEYGKNSHMDVPKESNVFEYVTFFELKDVNEELEDRIGLIRSTRLKQKISEDLQLF